MNRSLTAAFLTILPALALADPVSTCREAHSGEPAAHIACLEEALRRAGAAPASASIGAEQIEARARSRDPERQQQAVQLVSVSYDARERGVFRTADGQLWREVEVTPERLRLAPGKEYAARIERGTFGGYRMHVDGVRWMMKVERLE